MSGGQDELLDLVPRAHVLLEGTFHADGLLGARGGDRARVDAPGEVVEMVSGGDAEQLRQARDGSTGEVADRVNTLAVEDGPGPAADTPQCADG